MKIGEFAQITGMPISVLRHYDKEGLLTPDYVDVFSGYRHYAADQTKRVRKIELLKRAGLSLKEIRDILDNGEDASLVSGILSRREKQYVDMLAAIREVKNMALSREGDPSECIMENQAADQVVIEKNGLGETIMKGACLPLPLVIADYQEACRSLELEIQKRDFQRISGFLTYGEESGRELYVAAKVVKLRQQTEEIHEDISLAFEDDERAVGRWRVLGEYAVKEDFYAERDRREAFFGNRDGEVYFLPGGEPYWIFGWTKGYVKLKTGDQSCLCSYQIEDYQGCRYMFLENKSYEYRRGGMPTVLVLEQLDKRRYTKREIAREDNLDIPFVNDERVLGGWRVFDFIRRREDFIPGAGHGPQERLFCRRMYFGDGGELAIVCRNSTIEGKSALTWTKGYALKHYNHTACAYEIVTADGVDYMIVEWKSGDYIWGGFDTNYYVFVRE